MPFGQCVFANHQMSINANPTLVPFYTLTTPSIFTILLPSALIYSGHFTNQADQELQILVYKQKQYVLEKLSGSGSVTGGYRLVILWVGALLQTRVLQRCCLTRRVTAAPFFLLTHQAVVQGNKNQLI